MIKPRRFIARGGEAAWTGPSAFGDAHLYVFGVKAKGSLVHEMFGRYIGRPSHDLGLSIDVLGNISDQVLFVFLDSERHQPRGTKSSPASEGRQREQLFAIMVVGYRQQPDPGLVLFLPYVYASDTPGWRAEREIFGYPQQRGDVYIDDAGRQNPGALGLKLPAIARFSANANTADTEVLRIERKPGAVPAGPVKKSPPRGLVQAVVQALRPPPGGHGAAPIVPRARLGITAADASFLERGARGPATAAVPAPDKDTFIEALASGRLTMLLLKQFRDVVLADRACYQAIVEAPINVGRTTTTELKDYVLNLNDLDSAPIRRELGIPKQELPVDFAFRVDVDEMSIGPATVISNPYWNPAVEVSLPDTPSRLPRYVDRGGDAVWRQPSLLHGARIYGFGVHVPLSNQRALLKECVNDVAAASRSTYGPRPFKLEPVPGLDMIMLLFVEYQRITSATDDDRRLGGTRYREFLAMQLALSTDPSSPELDWFIPFIYLDTDSPRLAGREIFGYPKQLGTIKPFRRYRLGGAELEPARELHLSATVIHRNSETRAEPRPIVRIVGPNPPPRVKKRYLRPQDMFEDLIGELGQDARKRGVLELLPALAMGGGSGSTITDALMLSNVGNVFLKQFRDCTRPKFACYQAICKTDTVPGQFHGGGCLEPSGYRITIENHASEPLLKYIKGSRTTGRAETITPVFAYWLDLDLQLTNGRVVANPYETPYIPDLSAGKTPRDEGVQPRMIRRSRHLEL